MIFLLRKYNIALYMYIGYFSSLQEHQLSRFEFPCSCSDSNLLCLLDWVGEFSTCHAVGSYFFTSNCSISQQHQRSYMYMFQARLLFIIYQSVFLNSCCLHQIRITMTESTLIVYKCQANAVHKRKCLSTGQTRHVLVQMGSALSQLNIYQQHVGGSKWNMAYPREPKYV